MSWKSSFAINISVFLHFKCPAGWRSGVWGIKQVQYQYLQKYFIQVFVINKSNKNLYTQTYTDINVIQTWSTWCILNFVELVWENMNTFLCSSLSLLVSAILCDPRHNQACEMLVVVDETLYVSYGSEVRTVINLVDEHIGRFSFNSLF